jgi:hypothetical protein
MSVLDDLLAEYRRLLSLPASAANPALLNPLRERIGEAAADLAIHERYGSQVKRKLVIPRRGTTGPTILDIAYELQNRELIVVESKFGGSLKGFVADRRVFAASEAGAAEQLILKQQIEQLDPVWVKDRIREIRGKDHRLANQLDSAFERLKLNVVEVRTTPHVVDGRLAGVDTEIIDETARINEYVKTGRPVITDAARAVAKKEAFLENDLKKAVEHAQSLDTDAQRAEGQARKAQKKAEQAAKHAREAKKEATRTKRQEIAKGKSATAEALGHEAESARAAAKQAKAQIKPVERELKKQTQLRETLTSQKRELARVALESRASARRAAADPAVATGRGLTGETRLSRAVRVFALTRRIGRFAVTVFVPLTVLEVAFEIALLILEWDQQRRAADKQEWNRVIQFLVGPKRTIAVLFVRKYTAAIGDVVEKLVDQQMNDAGHPENFLHWLNRWNADKNWLGFVYPKIEAALMRQELINPFAGAHSIRYFLTAGQPVVRFTTDSLLARAEREETEIGTFSPSDPANLFTGGAQNAPQNAYKEVRDAATGERYLRESDAFGVYWTRAKMVTVRYIVPSPVLTPFDYVIFKCRTLIVEILQFISRYDESFVVQFPFESVSGLWDINWYDKAQFPAPIHSENARWCIATLYGIIKRLTRHTAGFDDLRGQGKERRRQLLVELVPPNSSRRVLRDVALRLNAIAGDLTERQLVEPADPELASITNTHLSDSAFEIQDDLERIYRDLMSSRTARSFQYEYKGTLPPDR